MKYLTIFLFQALLCTLLTHADDSRENRVLDLTDRDFSNFPVFESPSDVAVNFFSIVDGVDDLYIQRGKEFRRIQPAKLSLSRTHFYDSSDLFIVYQKSINEEGEDIYTVAARCGIPARSKDIIIAMTRSNGELRIFSVDMSLDAQSLGSARFVNLTPSNLMVLLDEQRAVVVPGQSINASFTTDKTHFFNFKIAVQYEAETQMIFTKRYPFRGQTRRLFIGYVTTSGAIDQGPFRVYSHTNSGTVTRPIIASE
jgi:hypothetical protein